jgi:hypothetical protein
MPKLHLKIEMEVTVSKDFLEQFKLDEMGLNYNYFKFDDEEHGNKVLADEVGNKCFRNNSVTVYHVLATELSEEGEV